MDATDTFLKSIPAQIEKGKKGMSVYYVYKKVVKIEGATDHYGRAPVLGWP